MIEPFYEEELKWWDNFKTIADKHPELWGAPVADPLKDIRDSIAKIETLDQRINSLQVGDLVSLDQNGKLIKATGDLPIKGVITRIDFDMTNDARTVHIMDHGNWIRKNTYRR